MSEATSLPTVAKYRQWLVAKRLPHQPGNNHAVSSRLPRAYGVEQPHDDGRQSSFPVVGVGQDLVDALRCAVCPARHPWAAQNPIRLLVQRARRVLAVDLRGARQHELATVTMSRLENSLCATDIRGERTQW